jgi:hypothetical protein
MVTVTIICDTLDVAEVHQILEGIKCSILFRGHDPRKLAYCRVIRIKEEYLKTLSPLKKLSSVEIFHTEV